MGIIQRQSIKNTIISMLGVAIGGISVLFIYPLDDEIYGLAQFLYSTAWFLMPFASLGVLSTILRFYPKFKSAEHRDHGFLVLILGYLSIAILIFLLLFFGLNDTIYLGLESLGLNAGLIREYQSTILLLTVVICFIQLFYIHAQNYHRIVVPQIIQGFSFKLFLPLLVLLYIYGYFNREFFTWALVCFFFVVLAGMIIYTAVLGQLKFSSPRRFVKPGLVRSMLVYSSFSGLSLMGSMLAARIDSIMVATMISLTSNGVYNKVLFIAMIIDIPTRAVLQIASPIISEHSEKGNIKEIHKIYQQSSLNLLVAGIGIFLLIWFTIIDIFGISVDPDSFENGKLIFLFLAIGKLFDMITSVNSQIIIFSKSYKVNLVFVLILGGLNLFLNYFFISEYGIVGAAIGTCISLILYNVMKFVYIWVKFGIQPLTSPVFKVFAIGAFIFGLMYFFPDTGIPLVNIALKGFVIVSLYTFLILRIRVSEEVNEVVMKILRRIGIRS